ncbi:MAG: GNAT family N-acetyltransferase [Bacteroidales bacterium]
MQDHITLEKVSINERSTLERIKIIANEIFPAELRRDFNKLYKLIESEPRFNCIAIRYQGNVIGFISFWEIDGECAFTFGEHMAIIPEMQNKNIGSCILLKFIQSSKKPIVIEVEPPISETSVKRVRLFQKCGFIFHNEFYEQPAYLDLYPAVRLNIMTYDCGLSFESIKETIHKVVYESSH